jgi:hypothetical protein
VKSIAVLEMSTVLQSANCLSEQRVALVLEYGRVVDAQIVSGGMQWNSTKLEIEMSEAAPSLLANHDAHALYLDVL